jgi:hypothetical protein
MGFLRNRREIKFVGMMNLSGRMRAARKQVDGRSRLQDEAET